MISAFQESTEKKNDIQEGVTVFKTSGARIHKMKAEVIKHKKNAKKNFQNILANCGILRYKQTIKLKGRN